MIDTFPHDHPLLDQNPEFNDLAAEMSDTLNAILKNDNEHDKIHGFMFVYDSSNKATFDTMCQMIDVVKEIERSERRGKKVHGVFNTSKVVVGTKRDRKKRGEGPRKNDFKKVESMRIKEVSALTN